MTHSEEKFFAGEDAPLLLGFAEDDQTKEGKGQMSRSERRAQRNKMKSDETDADIGEFQTLESAQRQKYEWWGGLSKDKDLNGLHHSSKYFILHR